jgi:hypothetical protein
VWNVHQGDTIQITATFDTSGVSTLPSSVTLTLIYPTLANPLTTASCSIGMTANSTANWVATWASSVSAYGLVSVSAAPAAGTTLTDTLRITS